MTTFWFFCPIAWFVVYCVYVCWPNFQWQARRVENRKANIGSAIRQAMAWWCHQMETFSASLAICAGNSPIPGELPTQRPVTRGFDIFFDLRPNKRLSKHWWGWWFETPSRPLWRHCMFNLHFAGIVNITDPRWKIVVITCMFNTIILDLHIICLTPLYLTYI